ncbi:MAG TPA: hypothetical protein VK789_15575 [Bryobacteraceae bacterium]|nr:hypothetical protein [Bryobacteraceae bacterium]
MIVKSVWAGPLVLCAAANAFGQTPPPAARGPESAYQQAGRLPARILDFSVEASSIQPGQSVVLKWSVENPSSVDIDQGVGPVRPKAMRKLTPAATTTYTLTVRGPNGVLTKTATVTVAGTTPVAAAATDTAPKKTPRMPDGKPDLTGVYNSSSIMFAGRQAVGMRDPIVATLKPGAGKYMVVRGPDDTGLTSDCMPTGVPEAYFMPYQFEILQALIRLSSFTNTRISSGSFPLAVRIRWISIPPGWATLSAAGKATFW